MSPGRRSRPAGNGPAAIVKADTVTIPPTTNNRENLVWVDHPRLGRVPALPLPEAPGCVMSGWLELPGDRSKHLSACSDEDFEAGARLSRGRLRRCKPGSQTWWWHTAVIAEHERRRRALFTVLSGGAR